ncbi:hypothetical protein P154DRAFT_575399 [Amniculicola lignicola CBS 123094]|uniref:Uncharacterized protein n=1 Tax=Amniculicola lignicola CBS 123094 TaxID=1392246 RepID=A0A6A5WHV2_9PLEO|nr:hypothetical protein P154DRAFT_575399 [Amniculicola lignicola CBS 123094]
MLTLATPVESSKDGHRDAQEGFLRACATALAIMTGVATISAGSIRVLRLSKVAVMGMGRAVATALSVAWWQSPCHIPQQVALYFFAAPPVPSSLPPSLLSRFLLPPTVVIVRRELLQTPVLVVTALSARGAAIHHPPPRVVEATATGCFLVPTTDPRWPAQHRTSGRCRHEQRKAVHQDFSIARVTWRPAHFR